MNQNDRDKVAIATVLKQMGACSYQDIALRAGERLASPLMEMVQDGEVERLEPANGQPATYRIGPKLRTRGGTSIGDALASIAPKPGDPGTFTVTEETLDNAKPPTAEDLAAAESARELPRMLSTGEARLADESGSR